MNHSLHTNRTVPTELSVWAYPWDIADEGAAAALDWLSQHNFTGIDLCPNYHAIATYSARNPRRTQFYSEQGAVYFHPQLPRYGRIRPKVHDEPAVLDVYGEVATAASNRDMQLNAWVIGMFQPWIARTYPDTAIENAFGDRSYAATCPAHPDVQTYLSNLLCDLCDQFPIDNLTLENVGYPEFTYGWVRPRILVYMSPWASFLSGLCFNEHSMSAARAHGVDPEHIREIVARELREYLSHPVMPGAADPPLSELVAERCTHNEEFRGYLEARDQSAAGTVKIVRHALRGHKVRIGISGASPGWAMDGLRLHDLLPTINALMLADPTDEAETANQQLQAVRDASTDIQITINQTAHYEADPHGPGFVARADRIASIRPDRVMVYNFGLVPAVTLAHVGSILHERLN